MKKYAVIKCGRCGLPQYVPLNQATRQCPQCHYHMKLDRALIVRETDDLQVALALVKYLKLPEGERDALWDQITAHNQRQKS